MAGNIPTDYRVGDKICIQDGQCGEVVATAENGVELKLANGEGISVPTGNLDHGTLKIGGGNYIPLSDMIINYRNLTELDPKKMFKGHMKSAEPLKDTPIQHTGELNGESIRHVLITPKQEKLLIERFEKAIETYKKTAKPAEAERLSRGLKTLLWDIQKDGRSNDEEGPRGEEIRMERYPKSEFIKHLEISIREEDIAASLRPIIEAMKRDIRKNAFTRTQIDQLLDESGVAPARKKE